MAKTVAQSFSEYKGNLEITDRQSKLVSDRRARVVAAIGGELELHPTSPSLVIGSYDRFTLTRYLSEGDVDTLLVLHYGKNKEWDSPDGTTKCLDKFKAILDAAFPTTVKRRDRNCITMQFSEFRLDVVPAFRISDSVGGDYYKIPDSVRREWVATDPIAFARKISAVNIAMGDTFVPLIKMVKGWNRHAGWPIRSFHLECMMHNHFAAWQGAYGYPYLLKQFLASLPSLVALPCFDPVKWDRVDTYLDNQAVKTKRAIAIEKASDAAANSTEAYEDQERYKEVQSIAIGEWKMLMGEFFPAYG